MVPNTWIGYPRIDAWEISQRITEKRSANTSNRQNICEINMGGKYMRYLIRTYISLIFLGFTLIMACTSKHIKLGNEYIANKQFCEAFREYMLAKNKDKDLEKDPAFKTMLKHAQVECLYSKASNLASRGEWEKAITYYEDALKIDPLHTGAKYGLQEAKRKFSNVLLKEGLRCADQGKLNEAISKLEKACKYNPQNRDAKEALELAIRTKEQYEAKAEEGYKKGLKYFNTKKWDKALSAFEIAIKYNPNHVLARNKVEETRQKIRETRNLYQQGMMYYKQKDWKRAIPLFEAALAISPYFPQAAQRIKEAQNQIKKAKNLYEQGMRLYKNKKLEEAYVKLKDALNTDPFNKTPKQPLAQICYTKAIFYEKKGKLGNALIECKKALTYVPDYTEASTKAAFLKNQICKSITYRVGILPFVNNTSDQEVVEQIMEELTKNLHKHKPSQVELIERAELTSILSEYKLSLSGITDKDIPIGKIKSLDALIIGKVLVSDVYTEKQTTSESERYQSGTRKEENEEYYRLQQIVCDLENQVARQRRIVNQLESEYENQQQRAEYLKEQWYDAKRDWESDCMFVLPKDYELRRCKERRKEVDKIYDRYKSVYYRAEDIRYKLEDNKRALERLKSKLSNAKEKFYNTSRYIEVPVYSDWHYRVTHYHKQATVKISLKIIDVLTGEILFTDTFAENESVKDYTIHNANPEAEVYPHTAKLPSDEVLKNKVISKLVAHVAQKAANALVNFGIRYFTIAQDRARVGSNEEIIENYVKFILSKPINYKDKIRKAINFIKKERDYIWTDLD